MGHSQAKLSGASAIDSFVRRLHTEADHTSSNSEAYEESSTAAVSAQMFEAQVGIAEADKKRHRMSPECQEVNHMLRTPHGADAFDDIVTRSRRVEWLQMTTGNVMVDQFEPWYFGVAFAFIFKYCTGMSDAPCFRRTQRYRRVPDAPEVPLARWMSIMSRRIEGQVARDWVFGFSSWNLMFRSAVNLSRTFFFP